MNQYIKNAGYQDTYVGRRLGQYQNVTADRDNYTSGEDVALLLTQLYKKSLVSQTYSDKMLELLLAQERRHKLPSLIPREIAVANKTGELPGREYDSGIIYGTTPYIICMMGEDVSHGIGQGIIASLSQILYEYIEEFPVSN